MRIVEKETYLEDQGYGLSPLSLRYDRPFQSLSRYGEGLGKSLSIAVMILDAFIVILTGYISFSSYYGISGIRFDHVLIIVSYALVVLNTFTISNVYRMTLSKQGLNALSIFLPSALFMILVFIPPVLLWLDGRPAYLGLDRLIGWALSGATAMATVRLLISVLSTRLYRSSRFIRKVAIVGDTTRAQNVLDMLERSKNPTRVVAVITERAGDDTSESLEKIFAKHSIDDVIVALSWEDRQHLDAWLDRLSPFAVDVHLFPDHYRMFMGGRGLSLLDGIAMIRLGIKPLSGGALLVKAFEDKIIGGMVLLLLAPVFLIIAVAIKLDSSGPVFFRQQRYGYDNKPFTCFKFRTMRADAGNQPVIQATRNDPRVTRVGKFLRRSSLDELPQLLNVMNGTMSLVGPRPHAADHQTYYQHLVDYYRSRHRMKPGVTGLAQINGCRGETANIEQMRKRVLYDLDYIETWSFWRDVKILLLTPVACLRGTNAY